MVCVDGFILTHAYEQVDMPDARSVAEFVGPFKPPYTLDPEHPVTAGALVGPEAFAEVRYLAHHTQLQALKAVPRIADDFATKFRRASGGYFHSYGVEGAETVVVAMGSVIGTARDVADELREAGHSIGVMAITCFRPFPFAEVREALRQARRVIVIDRSITAGMGGPLSADVRLALENRMIPVSTVVAGLGGRPITKASLRKIFELAPIGELPEITFLDLNWDMVKNELGAEVA